MDLSHPAHDVIGPNPARVLGRLAVLPDGASGRRIHELSGVANLATTQKILDRFVRIGLVNVSAVGAAYRYVLNRGHVLWKPLEMLLEMPAALESELSLLIDREFDGAVQHAVLYGSFARGTADNSSDIDVLLVWRDDDRSPLDRAELVEHAVELVRTRTGNNCQFLGLTERELETLIRAGDPLAESLQREGRALTEGTAVQALMGGLR